MTASQRKKLAQAARELAMECVAGIAPDFSNSGGWCNCAAGWIVRRAYGFSEREVTERWERAAILDERGILTEATSAMRFDRGALVFPLLWAADELEAQDG